MANQGRPDAKRSRGTLWFLLLNTEEKRTEVRIGRKPHDKSLIIPAVKEKEEVYKA